MNTNDRPIIFLAFANDYEGGYGYLPELASERRNLQAVLDRAQQEGLCEVVLRSDATLDDLVGVFQDARYRGRITIFHFGGHAGAYELLLQNADGKNATAYADGLAAFFGRQPNLQLVFLNGCSTQPHVTGLHDAGIPVVIATHAEIGDQLAGDFALRFYQGLATGATIESAYYTAEAACRAANAEVGEFLEAGYLPWALSVRPGAEAVSGWSLPEAAGDPLFGLPPLPPGDLPDKPFRNILWFRREDAPIFFGRGYAIRELYQRVTAPGVAPIVLYYGQSGVGRSSLLAAGLLPRLEQVHTVVYTRRDQALGLVGTLAASLLAAYKSGSADDPTCASGAELLDRWRATEAETGKPLTVILDQVEEVYTRPNEAMPGEMDDFLAALVVIFADPAMRPQGRLILSFRKEWLAEIEKLVADRHLPRARVFLQRLDRRGIIEAVTGPARSERLRQHFGLRIEDGLAAEIAADLLADPSSAVAPTLQILLSKLWEQAKARDYDRPHFDHTLYHDLRRKGLLLGDFLDQQLAALRTQQPAAVDSGLALDLLAFHTTPLGTAEQRTLAELRNTYAHQSMTVDSLLVACRDLFLLVDPAENHPGAKHEITRLAHDTLAPLVRHRFEESDAPGQRARRILESRVPAGKGNAPAPLEQDVTPLGDADLDVVVMGRGGMRTWNSQEQALVAISMSDRARRLEEQTRIAQEREDARQREVAQERRLAEAQRLRAEESEQAAVRLRQRLRIAIVASVIAVIMLGIAGYAVQVANRAQETAQTEAENARLAQAVAERQAMIARARQLATQSASELGNDRYDHALLLAIEAGRATQMLDYTVQEVFDAIQNAIARPDRSIPHRTILLGHTSEVWQATWSQDESKVLTSSADGTARIWDAASGKELIKLAGHTKQITQATWSQDESKILTASVDETVRIWDAASGKELVKLEGHVGSVWQATWSQDESKVLTASSDSTARIWDAASGAELAKLEGHVRSIRQATWSKDESKILTASWDNTARIWNAASGKELVKLDGHTEMITQAMWSQDESKVLTSSADGTARIWDVAGGKELSKLEGHTRVVIHATWSQDESKVLTASDDGTARIWDAANGKVLVKLVGHTWTVRQATWSKDESKILTASNDATVRIWDADSGNELLKLKGHTGAINQATWSKDESRILTFSWDGTARIWEASNGDELLTLTGHSSVAVQATWSEDESKVLTASYDGTARIWETASDQKPFTLTSHTPRILQAIWTPDESKIFTTSEDGTARIWDAGSGKESIKLEGHTASVLQAMWSQNESKILTTSADGTARIWDASSGREMVKLEGHTGAVEQATWSQDELKVLTTSADGTSRIWNAISGKELVVLMGHTGSFYRTRPIHQATWSPDESKILTSGGDGTARIWDAASGQELVKLAGQNYQFLVTLADQPGELDEDLVKSIDHMIEIYEATWSKDGSKVLTHSSSLFFPNAVRIFDAATGEELIRLEGHTGMITQAMWSQDESRVLTASWDDTARIWDAASGKELIRLTGHTGAVGQATWSQDESKVLTASSDSTARIWDAASGRELVKLEDSGAKWSKDQSRVLIISADNIVHIMYIEVGEIVAAACHRAQRNFTWEEWNRFSSIEGYRPTCDEALIPLDVIDAIRAQAATEVQAGNLVTATAMLNQLDGWLRTNGQYSTFEVETNPYLNLAKTLFEANSYVEGMVALANAQAISPTINITEALSANSWNDVCRRSALAGAAIEAMPACERAAALMPEHGGYRDSRGLARALTGDVPGAIADFRFFVEWAKTTGRGRNVDWREAWIARLEAGESPDAVFDAETLERLRNE